MLENCIFLNKKRKIKTGKDMMFEVCYCPFSSSFFFGENVVSFEKKKSRTKVLNFNLYKRF